MRWTSVAASLVLIAAFAAPGAYGPVRPAYAACAPGTKIDRSTAAEARKKIAAAGYGKVSEIKKACDNFWHAVTEKNGAQVRVAVSPDGHIYPEGD